MNDLVRELEEVKELHRVNAVGLLGKRYTAIRIKLIRIRSVYSGWTLKQRTLLLASITKLAKFERLVEDAGQNFEARAFNRQVNKEIDKLVTLLLEVENDGAASDA